MDLGGTFILAYIVINQMLKKLDKLSDQIMRQTTLLAILVKDTTNFTQLSEVFNGGHDKVLKQVLDKKNPDSVPTGK